MEKGINPKDLVGATKLNLSLVPPAAIVGIAKCMTNGAAKYGPYNWREQGKPVQTMTYLAAALRHIYAYLDGEEVAEDSGCNHLDHAMSGLAVLRDAQMCKNCIDDRPNPGNIAEILSNSTPVDNKK